MIEYNLSSDVLKNLYGQIYGPPGIFRIADDGGIYVGRKRFTNPADALSEIRTNKLQSFTRFDNKSFYSSGAARYKDLEERMRAIRKMAENNPNDLELQALAKNLTMDRISFEGDSESVQAYYKELIREELDPTTGKKVKVSYGLDRPGLGDSPHVVLRMYSGDKELTSEQMRYLERRAGISFEPAMKGVGEAAIIDPKAIKRYNTILDLSDFRVERKEAFRAHVLDLEQLKGEIFRGMSPEEAAKVPTEHVARVFDGMIVVSPDMVRQGVKDMRAEAKLFARVAGTDQASIDTRAYAASLERKAKIFEEHLEGGASFEKFRALGMTDADMKWIPGMAKGDALVPTDWGWRNFAKKHNIAPGTHFVYSPDSLTGQMTGTTKYLIDKEGNKIPDSYIGEAQHRFTMSVNEPNRHVFADIESRMVFPELYPDDQLRKYTRETWQDYVDEFFDKGTLPEGLKESYKATLEKEPKAGETNIISLLDQKTRAQWMLDMEALGTKPEENFAFGREFMNSMVEWMRTDKRHPLEPRFFAQGTVGAHIRPAYMAEELGFINYKVQPGKLGFDRDIGVLMEAGDVSRSIALHGGFDFDDRIPAHTFLVEQRNGEMALKSVLVRNPVGPGEATMFDWMPEAIPEVTRQLAVSNPKIRARSQYIDAQKHLGRLKEETDRRYTELTDALASGETDVQDLMAAHAAAQAEQLEQASRVKQLVGEIHDRLPDMTQAQLDALRHEDLLREVVPTKTGAEAQHFMETFDTIGDAIRRKDTASVSPKTQPLFMDLDAWLKKKRAAHPGFKFKIEKPRVELTKESLGLTGEIKGMDDATRAFRNIVPDAANVKGLLGRARNLDFIASSLRPQIEARMKAGTLRDLDTGQLITQEYLDQLAKEGKEWGIIPTKPTELIADLLSQAKVTPDMDFGRVFELMSAKTYGIAEAVARYGFKLPMSPELFYGEYDADFDTRIGGRMRGQSEKLFNQYLGEINPGMDPSEIFAAPGSEEAFLTTSSDMYKQLLQQMEGPDRASFLKVLQVPKVFRDTSYATPEIYEASRLAGTFHLARQQLQRDIKTKSLWELPEQQRVTEMLEQGSQSIAAGQVRRVLADMEGVWHPETGEITEHGLRVVGAFMQQHGKFYSNLQTRTGLGDVFKYAQVHAETHGGERINDLFAAGSISKEGAVRRREILDRPPRREDLIFETPGSVKVDEGKFDAEVRRIVEGGELPGDIKGRRLTESAEASRSIVDRVIEKTPFRDINGAELREFIEKPLVRHVGIGAGLLVAGSYIYRKFRNRAPEDLGEPAYLPGGSPYEQMPDTRMPTSLNRQSTPLGGGVTYKVMARGNFDEGDLRSQAEAITGMPSSGTIYRSRNTKGFGKNNDLQSAINNTYGGGF